MQCIERRAFSVPRFMFVRGRSLKLVDFIFVAQIIYRLLKISITHVLSNSAELNVEVYEAPKRPHETPDRYGGPAHQQLPHLKERLLSTSEALFSLGISGDHCLFWVQGTTCGNSQSSQDILLLNTKDQLY